MAKVKVKKDGTPSRQGEGGGPEPKFKTEKELRTKVLEYFKDADERKRMYSKAGLLHCLDISRSVYADYKKKFPETLRLAEYAIEEDWVNRLSTTVATGAIFYLKNAFKEDYKDRTESDIKFQEVPILGNVRKTRGRLRKNGGSGENNKS